MNSVQNEPTFITLYVYIHFRATHIVITYTLLCTVIDVTMYNFSMVIFFMVCLDGIYGVSEYDCGHLHQFPFESLTPYWLYTYLLFISWALFPAVFLSDPLVHVPLSGCLGDASHGRPPLCLLLITWGGGITWSGPVASLRGGPR